MPIYEFLGGSRDGQKIDVNQTLKPGEEIRMSLLGSDKAEIYFLGQDNRYHFVRLGAAIQPAKDIVAFTKDFSAILQKLLPIVQELDALIDEHGHGKTAEYPLGNWVLRHKNY